MAVSETELEVADGDDLLLREVQVDLEASDRSERVRMTRSWGLGRRR